ncbi:hypothetical protein V1291_004740 [Nitrobacteraceae bacterium AZCC 1564]
MGHPSRLSSLPSVQHSSWGHTCAISERLLMLGIPRRYAHFVFGVIQSGLTSCIAAGIASYPLRASGGFVGH